MNHEMRRILVFADTLSDGFLTPESEKALIVAEKFAQEAHWSCEIFVSTCQTNITLKELGKYELVHIFLCRVTGSERKNIKFKFRILQSGFRSETPSLIIAGDSDPNREIVARLSAKQNMPVMTNCFDLCESPDAAGVGAGVFVFGEAFRVFQQCSEFPCAVLVSPRTQCPGSPGKQADKPAEITYMDFPCSCENAGHESGDVLHVDDELNLEQAEIIVAGGRGVGGPEGFEQLAQLAGYLGGVVGATRAAVDMGWIGAEHLIGQSGKIVKPRLYIACGIEGSVQHLAGMRNSECIVAINRNPRAAIFQYADYGIVEDFSRIIPALLKEAGALHIKKRGRESHGE